MSELTQTLKIFVTRYPGTMAELPAKRRSTAPHCTKL